MTTEVGQRRFSLGLAHERTPVTSSRPQSAQKIDLTPATVERAQSRNQKMQARTHNSGSSPHHNKFLGKKRKFVRRERPVSAAVATSNSGRIENVLSSKEVETV